METRYKLEFKDYRAAQKLHAQTHLWTRVSLWLVALGFPLLGLYFLQVIISNRPEGVSPLETSGILSPLWLIGLGVAIPLFRLYGFRKQFKQMFPKGNHDRECYLIANDELLVSGIHGASEGRFFWPSLFRVVSDENIMLIYVAKKQFLFIPLKKLDTQDREELVDLAQKKIGTT